MKQAKLELEHYDGAAYQLGAGLLGGPNEQRPSPVYGSLVSSKQFMAMGASKGVTLLNEFGKISAKKIGATKCNVHLMRRGGKPGTRNTSNS
jgi:hypothetical protein